MRGDLGSFLSVDYQSYDMWNQNKLPKNLIHYTSLKETCTILISSFWFFLEKTHNPTESQPLTKSPKSAAFPLSLSAPHFTFDCSSAASFCSQMIDYQELSSLLPCVLHLFSWLAVIYSGPHILWQLTCEFLLFCYELSHVCSAFCFLSQMLPYVLSHSWVFCLVLLGFFFFFNF